MEDSKIRAICLISENPRFKPYPEYKESGVERIREIPVHWEMRKIKNTQSDLLGGVWGNEPEGNENDIYCIRVADFNYEQLTISTHNLTLRNIPLTEKNKRVLKNNDLLVEKSGGGEKSPVGKTVMFNAEIPRQSVTSNFITKFTAKSDSCFPKYLLYCLCFFYHIGLTRKHIKQTTGIQNLDIDSYFQEKIPLPSLVEQRAIANFLDRKTEQIDKLIRIKERQIELLQEQRTALINQAVTKGLDPNVEMKPSEVGWIGEIPRHWEVKRLKYIADLNMGQSPPSEEYNSDQVGTPFLQGNAELGSHHPTPKIYCPTAKKYADPGDILLSVRAPVGAINIANQEYGIGRGLCAIRPQANQFEHRYAKYLLEVVRAELHAVATGSTYDAVTVGEVSNVTCVVPPLSEQVQVANFLDRNTKQIDELITTEQRKIELLKEYRQSLISEAVTGKIDVRNEV